jgi:uncharacterized membrane protein
MKNKVVFLITVFSLFAFFAFPVMAENEFSGVPGGGFEFNAPYSGIVMGTGEKVDLDFRLRNLTGVEKTVSLNIDKGAKAKDWKVMFSSSKWDGFGITKVRLGRKDPDDLVEFKLHIEPSENAKPGEYRFIVAASSGRETRRIPVMVTLQGEKVAVEKGETDISLDCKYSSMENPAGEQFAFEVTVKNEGTGEAVVDFSTIIPDGWAASLSPRWEKDKSIKSIRIDEKGSEKLQLTLTPPDNVDEGKYPVTLVAKTKDITRKLELSASIKGTYSLKLIPETRRLNTDLVAGQENKLVFYLWNEGSAPVNNISMMSSQPEGWEVSFEPNKLTQVEPLSKTKKPEKVEVTFKVPERTIPGDYPINITAAGDQSRKAIELRATVKVPTTWGWAGIAVIAVVLILLAAIFMRLKRR